MSLLSYLDLRIKVQNRIVTPVPDENVNASSIDVRLGNTVLMEVQPPEVPEDEWKIIELGKREPITTESVNIDKEPFLLYPGQFVLAATLETFDLPLNMSAEFRLKSSVARMGLSHALAVWCDPGWTGSALTLELHNISQFHVISLRAGDKIGQVVFHEHTPVPKDRSYAARGAYNFDSGASATKPARS